jgi:hypothetical protein
MVGRQDEHTCSMKYFGIRVSYSSVSEDNTSSGMLQCFVGEVFADSLKAYIPFIFRVNIPRKVGVYDPANLR